MTNEKKYHEMLDKLADAIQGGKSANTIERIKDKIETIENQIYIEKVNFYILQPPSSLTPHAYHSNSFLFKVSSSDFSIPTNNIFILFNWAY